MKKSQEDILNMYQTTADVLQTHNAVWAANVPFSTSVTQLGNYIDQVEDLRDIQEADTTGVAQDKQNKRQALEEQTFAAGSIITFYASTVNNRELMQKVNFKRYELRNARDNELPGMAEQVHQEAVANAAAVLPFGLTAAMTTALGTAISDFVTYISKPRAAKTETSAATEQLPPLFDAANNLLEEQLDGGMELYRVSDPAFYNEYFNARIIVNSPTLKRALEAHFVDELGAAIEHLNVKVDAGINRRSSVQGNIRVQNLTEGAHVLKTSLPGWVEHTENFNVISGETTKLDITLRRS